MSKQKKNQETKPVETVTDAVVEVASTETPVEVVAENVPPAGEPISAVSAQVIETDGGNQTKYYAIELKDEQGRAFRLRFDGDRLVSEGELKPDEAASLMFDTFGEMITGVLREKTNVVESVELKSPEVKISADTVTVDKKAFAKLIYALVVGQPTNYLRFAAIPRLGDLFHVKEYSEQVKLWNELKEYHNAG